ncbi:MAG: molybdopterin-dependent oxidoreductase [Actinomycetota bacterium]|nr:molybdopterin-dependent oxidoreductase [Actinomycetota bacterium]
MGRKRWWPFIFASLLMAISLTLFLVYGFGGKEYLVVGYDEVLSMPSTRATYHSINNWQTVEDTEFEGVALHLFLERCGITAEGAEVRLIAPDGYFWPAVGSVLTLADLKRRNAQGLLPLLAWEMNGERLQPEPDGSGPLRLVMPQYEDREINKPSWVSNLRLIEIGPVDEGSERPDPKQVPLDELWVYGDVPSTRPFSPILPLAFLIPALLLLGASTASCAGRKGRGKGMPRAAAVALAVMLASSLAAGVQARNDCHAATGGGFVFTMSEIASMPSFSGHYTFLKSQEPFTYYEADYRGVPLTYLLDEKLRVAAGATGVEVMARDGYTVSLSLSQARSCYPGGLRTIIAYEKNGKTLQGEEGSLRLIVPQASPGNREQGGDANTPLCARMVYAVGVLPLPAGEQPPAASAVPEGSLAVYGAVSAPAPPPAPAPQPAPSPQPAPETSPQPVPGGGPQPGEAAPGEHISPPAMAFAFIAEGGMTSLVLWLAWAPMPSWPLGVMIISLIRHLGVEE